MVDKCKRCGDKNPVPVYKYGGMFEGGDSRFPIFLCSECGRKWLDYTRGIDLSNDEKWKKLFLKFVGYKYEQPKEKVVFTRG